MAKSFFNILKDGILEVSHQGEQVELDLPDWFLGAESCLENEQALTEWARTHDCLLGLLHAGIQKTIIDMRAIARPSISTKTGESKSIVADQANAQTRLNRFTISPAKRPGQVKAASKAVNNILVTSVQTMLDQGFDSAQIKTMLSPGFGSAQVALVLNDLALD